MSRWYSPLLPHRIGGQILLLVAVAIIVTQALNFAVLLNSEADRREEAHLRSTMGTFLSAVRMMAGADTEDWPTIASIVQRTEPQIDFRFQPGGDWPAPVTERPTGVLAFLDHELGPAVDVRQAADDNRGVPNLRNVAVHLQNGLVITARLQLPTASPRPPLSGFNYLIFALVFVPLLLLWVARHLSGQLRNFARAAEEFSLDGGRALPETGPEEIQQAARAFNRMRERISRLVNDRTRMLGAISHDLRTPITRLRLRAEFIEDEKTREEILKDLDRMKRMVNSALTFIRDGTQTESPEQLDLPALIRTVIDNFAEVGEQVSYEGLEQLTVSVKPDALVRAVENLIENGIKFGTRVIVRTSRIAGQLHIEVEDDGMGIPADAREAMLEPFVRGDVARGDPTTGFGLGLSIAASIARAHGGELQLTSGELGGLLARIVLPLPDMAAQPAPALQE